MREDVRAAAAASSEPPATSAPRRGVAPLREASAEKGRAVIRVGTSGYLYRHWRGVLYPEGLAAARLAPPLRARSSTPSS